MKTKVSNSWKDVSGAMVKVSGAWKQVDAGYVKINGIWKEIYSASIPNAVNLGLPSGTLWAKGNIVQDGTSYKIGEETDYGTYTSWGNSIPHFSTNGSTFDDGYDFGSSNSGAYASTPGASIQYTSQHKNNDYATDSNYDVAHVLLGKGWRVPTANAFQELYDNCSSVWTTKNGIAGCEFTSNINGEKIFFPAAGFGMNATLRNRGTDSYYWSSSLSSSAAAYAFRPRRQGVITQEANQRFFGFSVRAVCNN